MHVETSVFYERTNVWPALRSKTVLILD